MKNNLPDKQSNFLLYTGNDGKVNVEVFLKDETVWLTQKAIGELFGIERSVITKHLKNIFSSGKLYKESNVQKMHFGYEERANNFHFGNSSKRRRIADRFNCSEIPNS